ncbi:E3 ubiquitin-protein ligase RNF14, partial [Trifolium medium]|nr:E3 ubiquitin-protein ligase RNF14 [Trifolium medium]
NNNNKIVDDVASSSKTKEEDDDDGIDIMDDRLDKLLSDIQQPELSQEQIIINDQLQQDE